MGQEWAIVETTRLHLRHSPSQDSPSLAVLPKGTRAKLIERRPQWAKVSIDGKTGYLSDQKNNIRVVADQEPTAGRIESLQRKAETIDRQIAQQKTEVAEITAQERDTIADLDAIDRKLSQTRASLADLQGQLRSLHGAIDQTDAAIAALKAGSVEVRKRAARRMTALYKLHWLGRVQLLAGSETVTDFLTRETALRHILAADDALLTRYGQQRQRLEALVAAQTEQLQHQATLEAEVDAQVKTAAAERDRRQQILSGIRDRKALALASIEALEKAAARLDETIEKLGQDADPPAAALSPAAPFHARKGLLKMPVKGRIVNFFGRYRNPRFNTINIRSGIDIRAEKGEPIRAVHSGRVLYAEWFKGYGNMMIIDHGDAYYTVYAHAEEMLKQKGAAVEAGEVIATVGDTGSLEGALLHFEVRRHGKPEDPLGWLEKG